MSAGQIERRSGDPIYVYAIVPSGQGGQSAIAGMEAIAGRLGTIGEGPFSAVVGGGLAHDLKGRSREELGRLLLVHQQVTEQLIRVASVLPVKFGTQAPDEMGVREALERGRCLFETVFAELEGCTQLEVLITWDLDAVFANIAKEEPIARLKARMAVNAENVTPAERAALGRLVKDVLERRRAAFAGRLSEALRAVAVDAIVHPIVADRIVLHMALLVKSDAVDAVDRCLERLDAEFGSGLSFRCVGPTAPTSFATVEIEFLEADKIEQASRTLEIELTASAADVRFAYHRLARRVHPDTAGAREDGSAAMAALTKAYGLLSRYARAHETERAGNAPLCLDSAAARAVLVSVRRQDAASGGAAVVGRA